MELQHKTLVYTIDVSRDVSSFYMQCTGVIYNSIQMRVITSNKLLGYNIADNDKKFILHYDCSIRMIIALLEYF